MATCVVSFVDIEGFRHTIEVEAESLFEAGVLAIRAFNQNGCPPGYVSELKVEIRSPVKHITPKRIQEWLKGGAGRPGGSNDEGAAEGCLGNRSGSADQRRSIEIR
jgi:hypothetical protein